jgi:hypothetical protein
MLIDCGRNLYTVDKEVINEASGTKELLCPHCGKVVLENQRRLVPMTVRSVFSTSLQANLKEDEKQSTKQREELFDLLMKIHGNPVVELNSDEKELLRDRIEKCKFSLLISGQVLRILEGKSNPFEPQEDGSVNDGDGPQPD